MTYIIKYKEYGREWSSTSYSTPRTVTEDYLIEFQGHKASTANVAVNNDIRKAYGLNLINLFSGSSGILFLSFCATTYAG